MNATEASSYNNSDLRPSAELKLVPPLLWFISDAHLAVFMPVIAYWCWGWMYYFIDKWDTFPEYRIHTPAEITSRNQVPLSDVITCVAIQHAWQVVLGILLSNGPGFRRSEEYEIFNWVLCLRQMRGIIPIALALIGFDSGNIAKKLGSTSPSMANLLRGTTQLDTFEPPGKYENMVASSIYHVFVPMCQFLIAIFIGDSWQYWAHRISHQNAWLYKNLHSVHHQNHVPYALGAWYAHLGEAFVWDTIGTSLALYCSQLTLRQSMWFTTLSVLKSVDDHCGYKLWFNPLQWYNGQNAAYHDIHHQSWGMKKNYAQVYTVFWDWMLGTMWTERDEDTEERYKKSKIVAARLTNKNKHERKGSNEELDLVN